MLIYTVIPLLLPIMYCIMEKKHDKYPVVTKTTKHKDVKYTPLNTSSDEELHVSSETKVELSVRDKVDAVWKALPFALTMITGYFSSFFTLQSVVTTLGFSRCSIRSPQPLHLLHTCTYDGEPDWSNLRIDIGSNQPSLQAIHQTYLDFLLVAGSHFSVSCAWFLVPVSCERVDCDGADGHRWIADRITVYQQLGYGGSRRNKQSQNRVVTRLRLQWLYDWCAVSSSVGHAH